MEIKIEDIDDIMKVDFIEMTGSHRRFFEQNNFMIDFRQMILAAFCSIHCFEEQLGRRNMGKLSPELVTVKR